MSFEEFGIAPKLLAGVKDAGYRKPFPIQERAIRPLLAGIDVIGQAKTGSGKTAAFGLPLLQSVNEQDKWVQALVLAPTRELAQQITLELRKLGKYSGAKVLAVYGGQSINVQLEALARGVQVVVGTPGRVIDHLRRGSLDLGSARYVVLDEADTMLDMGFVEDVEYILDATPPKRQLSLFSATMPQRILQLSQRYMHEPQRILVDSDEPSVRELDQYFTVVEEDKKLQMVLEIMEKEKPASSIVFCRTRWGARRLARDLERRFLNAVPLHGDLSQAQRDHSMTMFRSGRMDVLVATDVASRGIDVPIVDCVINYNVPEDPLLYFHRVGRTARAGKPGRSFTLVSRPEMADFGRILNMTKVEIKPLRPEDAAFNPRAHAAAAERKRTKQGRGRSWKGGRRHRDGRWRRRH